jgi:nickel/cobalt transporter (NicO) family protein
MQSLTTLIQHGSTNLWLFIPTALLLGALHGLEPGHSKTMMAAFIIAIRGTVKQAIMLGLAATFSHTLIVWAIALLGLHYSDKFSAESSEPYLQITSGALIICIALWMILRTRREQRAHAHHHDHAHDHHHHHDEATEYQDAHARAHAEDIRKRFSSGHVTNAQIVLFGLTGGLIPCPAAITLLLLCLQLKQFSLGVGLVLCFSIGLAVTMVAAGTIAALSVRHAGNHFLGFGTFARHAPYFSAALIIFLGGYIGWQGFITIPH